MTRQPSMNGLLHNALTEAGIPVVSVSQTDPVVRTATIQFAPEATAEQQTQAQTILNTLDFRERRPKDWDALRTALLNLAQADRNKLILLAVMDLLRRRPDLARTIEGLSLDGDEPVE